MINRIRKLFNKYYNDDIQYFISSTKFKVIYELLLFSTGFLITWLFANITSIQLYGNYLYILSIGSFFSFLSFPGISGSIQQSVASGYKYFYISGMKSEFKYSIIGSIVILLFSIYYIFFLDVQISVLISLYILVLFFPFSSSFTSYHSFLDGQMQFKKDLFYRIISLIIQDGLLLIMIFITQNLIVYFLLLMISLLIINIIITRSCVKSVSHEAINITKEKDALKYGLFLTKVGFLGSISNNINYFLIGIVFNPATLAFYTIGIGLPNKLLNLIKGSVSTLLSKYSKKGVKIRKNFIVFILILSLLLFIFVIIVLPLFMKILFPKYIDSITYGLLYSFLVLIVPIATVFGYYCRAKTDKRTIQNIIIYPNIVKLLLLLPFLYMFGLNGLIFSEYIRWITLVILLPISLKKKKTLEK